MAKGDEIASVEIVVRALMHPYWEPNLKRISPSIFEGQDISVSRPSVLPIADIVSIFRADFDHRVAPTGESKRIRGTGAALVSTVIEQADRVREEDGKRPPIVARVVEDEIKDDPKYTDNPSHALIQGWDREDQTSPRKITKGVAKRLVDAFEWTMLDD